MPARVPARRRSRCRCWAGGRGGCGGRGRGRRRGNRGHGWHWYVGGSQGLDRHDKKALPPVLGVVGRAGVAGSRRTARIRRPHEECLAPVTWPFGIALEIGAIAVRFEIRVKLDRAGGCARSVCPVGCLGCVRVGGVGGISIRIRRALTHPDARGSKPKAAVVSAPRVEARVGSGGVVVCRTVVCDALDLVVERIALSVLVVPDIAAQDVVHIADGKAGGVGAVAAGIGRVIVPAWSAYRRGG